MTTYALYIFLINTVSSSFMALSRTFLSLFGLCSSYSDAFSGFILIQQLFAVSNIFQKSDEFALNIFSSFLWFDRYWLSLGDFMFRVLIGSFIPGDRTVLVSRARGVFIVVNLPGISNKRLLLPLFYLTSWICSFQMFNVDCTEVRPCFLLSRREDVVNRCWPIQSATRVLKFEFYPGIFDCIVFRALC